MSAPVPLSRTFGAQRVDEAEREARIRAVFESIARSPGAYTYLVESIRRFPDQRAFARMIERAGFREVRYRNLSFGIACIHVGVRAAAAGPA